MSWQRNIPMYHFSRAAEGYDARAQFQHGQTARVFDAANMLFPKHARIVDIGCGTGQFAGMASSAHPHWKVMGVDLAEGMCRVAATRCHAVQADVLSLPLADASCDGVVSSLCLQWIGALNDAFAEIARVLKPGGRAVIASLATQTLHELRAAAADAALPLHLLPMRSPAEYRSAVDAAGLVAHLFEAQEEIEYYPNVAALLDSMRLIGATSQPSSTSGGLTGARRWKAMLAAYDRLRSPEGLPATWERLFMVLHKPL